MVRRELKEKRKEGEKKKKEQRRSLLTGESDKRSVDDPPSTGAGAESDVLGLDHVQPEPPFQYLDSVATGTTAGRHHPQASGEPHCGHVHVSEERRARQG